MLHRLAFERTETEAWTTSHLVEVAGLTLERPVGVAAADDGRLVVVDEGAPAVFVVDADRAYFNRLNYNNHRKPWWEGGRLYLPMQDAGVLKFGVRPLTFEVQGRELQRIEAGARLGGGRWYLIDTGLRRVLRFGPDGAFQETLQPHRGGEPVDLAMDVRGRLYVLDARSGEVIRYGEEGHYDAVAVVGAWRRPVAIEVDRLGNIYVLDRDARTIDIYQPDGGLRARLGPDLPGGTRLRGPRDLAVDGRGVLYVVDRDLSAVVAIR